MMRAAALLLATAVVLSPIRDGVHTADYIEKSGAVKDIGFSEEDRELLLRVMMCEAGNQGEIGAAHVGRVILNRVESDAFPDTVRGVIYQPGQFTTASYLYRYEPNADCYAALELLERGWDETGGALYFCTSSFSWATYLYSYGAHNFFI